MDGQAWPTYKAPSPHGKGKLRQLTMHLPDGGRIGPCVCMACEHVFRNVWHHVQLWHICPECGLQKARAVTPGEGER